MSSTLFSNKKKTDQKNWTQYYGHSKANAIQCRIPRRVDESAEIDAGITQKFVAVTLSRSQGCNAEFLCAMKL